MAAHKELVARLLKLAGKLSPLAGLDMDLVIGRDGYLCQVDKPDRRESYVALMARAGYEE